MMIRRSAIFAFLLVQLFACLKLSAQEKDFQLWTDVSLKKEISKHWDLSFEQNLRFGNNAGRFDKSYSNLTLGYALKKYLKLDFMYRFVMHEKPDYLSYGHTFAFDATVRQKYSRFRFSLRNRFLYKYADILSSEEGKFPERYYRTKFEVGFHTRHFPVDPYLSAESFLFLPKGEKAVMDALRTSAGIEYAISKHQAASCYWMNEWGFNTVGAEDLFILGISYSYSF